MLFPWQSQVVCKQTIEELHYSIESSPDFRRRPQVSPSFEGSWEYCTHQALKWCAMTGLWPQSSFTAGARTKNSAWHEANSGTNAQSPASSFLGPQWATQLLLGVHLQEQSLPPPTHSSQSQPLTTGSDPPTPKCKSNSWVFGFLFKVTYEYNLP